MRSTDDRDTFGTNGDAKLAALVDVCRALVDQAPAEATATIRSRLPVRGGREGGDAATPLPR